MQLTWVSVTIIPDKLTQYNEKHHQLILQHIRELVTASFIFLSIFFTAGAQNVCVYDPMYVLATFCQQLREDQEILDKKNTLSEPPCLPKSHNNIYH